MAAALEGAVPDPPITLGHPMPTYSRSILVALALLATGSAAAAQTAAPGAAMTMPAAGPADGAPASGMKKMMPMMRGMMGGGDMAGGMPFEHVEGRVAYIKAELGTTEAQTPEWTAYAATMRADAKAMGEGMAKMMQAEMPTAAPARAEAMMQMMAARLDAMKAGAPTGKALYAVLSEQQKRTAAGLMAGPMGMMQRRWPARRTVLRRLRCLGLGGGAAAASCSAASCWWPASTCSPNTRRTSSARCRSC